MAAIDKNTGHQKPLHDKQDDFALTQLAKGLIIGAISSTLVFFLVLVS